MRRGGQEGFLTSVVRRASLDWALGVVGLDLAPDALGERTVKAWMSARRHPGGRPEGACRRADETSIVTIELGMDESSVSPSYRRCAAAPGPFLRGSGSRREGGGGLLLSTSSVAWLWCGAYHGRSALLPVVWCGLCC